MRTITFLLALTAVLFSSCGDAGLQEELEAAREQLAQAEAALAEAQAQTREPAGFIHTVFFWLAEDLSDEQVAAFEEGLKSLSGIETVKEFYYGLPAMTPREVVDNSYDYALILHFADKAGQDAYQEDSIHTAFVESLQEVWTRVQVYDTLVEDRAAKK